MRYALFAALTETIGWDAVFLEDYIVYQGREDLGTVIPGSVWLRWRCPPLKFASDGHLARIQGVGIPHIAISHGLLYGAVASRQPPERVRHFVPRR